MRACFIRLTAMTASTAPLNLPLRSPLMRSCAPASDPRVPRSALNHWCFSASTAVRRFRGSTTRSFLIRSLASGDTWVHTWTVDGQETRTGQGGDRVSVTCSM